VPEPSSRAVPEPSSRTVPEPSSRAVPERPSRAGELEAGPPVLAVVGPTAAGKSEAALEAAALLAADGGAEIVAVDAFTVYRGMDVGTAKPSAADRARVAHHGLDLLDPDEECTAEWFQAVARSAIADIRRRGRIPVLVGGSGLYFRTVVDPLEFPPTDAGVRAEVARRFGDDPVGAHAALAEVDPDAAARIDPANLRRTVRALEVHALTGRPFSDWRRAWDDHASVYGSALHVVGVEVERTTLRERIGRRVDAMVAGGLVEECAALRERWPTLSTTARQAIGYGEVLDHLAGRISLEQAIEDTKTRTRRYAARQARWFAGDPRVQWLAHPDVAPALRQKVSSPT
jgi:tRNA dimethylallyltransferase